MVTFEEELNWATGCISEAEGILLEPEVRAEMKRNSYLGEMTEEEIYKKALAKAEEAVEILTRLKWRTLPKAEALVKKINKILEPEKKIVKKEEIKIKTTPVRRGRRKVVK